MCSQGYVIPIVTGFIARGRDTGAITTLGRGGSDLTATALAAALEVAEVHVWKDVDGENSTENSAALASVQNVP